MKPSSLLLPFALLPGLLTAADLKPNATTEIPESARRPAVVANPSNHFALALPQATLPEGYSLELAAAAPLVLHPIMGCLDDQGRMFVGDATGVNWNKKQLEANPPNRVLMLEDTNKDGVFDKSTVFADKMTFPQGACWLKGSLYVCSPPGLWKLTDTNGDGVADQREMIVSGFEYTGNAADVHGPFLHPNGRLYWCHGRKGHKVIGKEGTVVDEGLACGIWSCQPDGSDVQWHSLGCGDNPVKVDFTPDGDIIGVQNLYYTNPRGDTLVHWLYKGVYERSDQLKAIAGMPRTLEHMPVMYNFGHVAVSGCCFWRGAPMGGLQMMVTHFNTQRLVRMDLTRDGSTYKAAENEFLKLNDPDIHLTDVMEDKDGSLLVVNTGGWFRIGCPSSLMAKPDIAGAIYRVKRTQGTPVVVKRLSAETLPKEGDIAAMIASPDLAKVRLACEFIAQQPRSRKSCIVGASTAELAPLSARALDAAAEHAFIEAWERVQGEEVRDGADPFDVGDNPICQKRNLQLLDRKAVRRNDATQAVQRATAFLDAKTPELASTALFIVTNHSEGDAAARWIRESWLKGDSIEPGRLPIMARVATAFVDKPEGGQLLAAMLGHSSAPARQAALQVLADLTTSTSQEAWLSPLDKLLGEDASPLLLDALKKLKSSRFDARLQAIADDAKQPQSLRLKALDAMSKRKLGDDTFALLQTVLTGAASSPSAKIQAAAMLAHSGLSKEQRTALSPALATVGPIELKELLALVRSTTDEAIVRGMAAELAKNPSLISQQESAYRTALTDKATDIFETIVLPSYRKAGEAIDAKKRQLAPLADKVIAQGKPSAGRAVYESGKGTCIVCHQIGDKGRSIGPNLSHIGGIRTERDLLESILFPSNTLARDYEAHVIETRGGETITGVIKSHTAEGLLVVDVAGQEKSIAHAQMVGDTQLTTSLMPMGLDLTLPEQDLLDLVAWLRSLK